MTQQGALSDARDVVVGSTNASLFAYVADGRNGLTVIQLTAPDTQPKFYGFSPEPKPQVIARYPTGAPALALSKGLDRDRGWMRPGTRWPCLEGSGPGPSRCRKPRSYISTRMGNHGSRDRSSPALWLESVGSRLAGQDDRAAAARTASPAASLSCRRRAPTSTWE